MAESVSPAPSPVPNAIARWRWAIHLLLLTAYPVVLGIVAAMKHTGSAQPMLPPDIKSLLLVLGVEALMFGAVFTIAVGFSRPSRRDLFLQWSGGLRPVLSGLVLSIALRIGIMLLMFGVTVALSAAGHAGQKLVQQLQPDVEQLVSAKGLAANPVYFILTLTVVSFVVAGLREELWRAGMLAGFRQLMPPSISHRKSLAIALLVSAIVFGFGHLTEGWGGVLLTTGLGVGLGMIILWKDSIWPAIFAHGFFDASTFLMLYLLAKFPNAIPGGSKLTGLVLLLLF